MLLPPPLKLARDQVAQTIRRDAPRTESAGPKSAIAFVDIETTGLDPARHEILEIAVVRVDADTLCILEERSVLVKPERIDQAEAAALEVCGFNEAEWKDALPLRLALRLVAPLFEDSLVAGHNVGFDWSFLEAGFRRTGLALPAVDYHRLDTASLAWPLEANGNIRSLSLDSVCEYLGLKRYRPHRALADARSSYQVALRLMDRMVSGARIAELPEDEREITETLLERLDEGRAQYGAWDVNDGRDYVKEAYEELLDGLHYIAAAMVQRKQQKAQRRRRVYVCHPFASDPAGNIERVRAISQFLIDDGLLPIAPHLYLPLLVDEATQREQALALCLEMLATCDEVLVFGDVVTEGMERELREAKRLGIPARFVREVRA